MLETRGFHNKVTRRQGDKEQRESISLSPRLLISLSAVLIACQPAPTPTGVSPAVTHPEIAGRRVVSREEVKPPVPAYNFRLTNHTGSPVSLEDLRGQVVVLSFLYTGCPDACPILGANYLAIEREFSDAVKRGDLALVFVTVDPERDTPERLRGYTQAMGGTWFFLSGSVAELLEVWQQYGVHREVIERTKEVIVYHSYMTYLIDRQGMSRIKHIGVWYTHEVIPDIRQLLYGQSSAVRPEYYTQII
jgi:protein SCO1/2